MDPVAILYPGIAMFFLTFSMVVYLGYNRFTAIRRRDVSIGYYRLYDRGEQPERLALLGRHVQNHFEVPPIFYAALLFTFVSGAVNPFSVSLAWLFVLSRCVHSYIHLGSNNVTRRFVTFITGGLILTGIWTSLLVSLLRA